MKMTLRQMADLCDDAGIVMQYDTNGNYKTLFDARDENGCSVGNTPGDILGAALRRIAEKISPSVQDKATVSTT